jgi:hypothetical protein
MGYNRRLSDHFACTFISFVLCEKNVPLPCRRRRRRAARVVFRKITRGLFQRLRAQRPSVYNGMAWHAYRGEGPKDQG